MAWPSLLSRTKNWGTEVLTDSDLEGQFDVIINYVNDMMSSTTGHKHDATTSEAPKILVSDLNLTSGASGDTLYHNGTNLLRVANGTTGSVEFVIGGSGIDTGIQGDIRFPFACTITGVYLLPDTTGDIVVDLWKDTYANYPPTVADTITASAKPTLTADAKYEDTTLTGWTKTVAAGDIIRVNVDSTATISRCAMIITFTRP